MQMMEYNCQKSITRPDGAHTQVVFGIRHLHISEEGFLLTDQIMGKKIYSSRYNSKETKAWVISIFSYSSKKLCIVQIRSKVLYEESQEHHENIPLYF